jgi:hypothetical protein
VTLRAVPSKLQTVGAVLLVSGAVDTFVSAAVVALGLSAVGGLVGYALVQLGCGLGGLLSLCGLWGLALLPLGMVELVCGAMVFVNPDGAGPFVRVGNLLQLGSGVFGGLAGVVGGLVVRTLLADPEVVAFLDSGDEG